MNGEKASGGGGGGGGVSTESESGASVRAVSHGGGFANQDSASSGLEEASRVSAQSWQEGLSWEKSARQDGGGGGLVGLELGSVAVAVVVAGD